jgi:hypothetical protein
MGTVMHWWAVGCDGSVPHFYEAPNGRNAVAQFRANLIEMERGSGVSLKDARIIVRGLEPQVLEGPLTAEEAYELDVAWLWAIAVLDESYLMLTHTGGISRKEAVERIGEDRVARLERSARKRYGLLASGPE